MKNSGFFKDFEDFPSLKMMEDFLDEFYDEMKHALNMQLRFFDVPKVCHPLEDSKVFGIEDKKKDEKKAVKDKVAPASEERAGKLASRGKFSGLFKENDVFDSVYGMWNTKTVNGEKEYYCFILGPSKDVFDGVDYSSEFDVNVENGMISAEVTRKSNKGLACEHKSVKIPIPVECDWNSVSAKKMPDGSLKVTALETNASKKYKVDIETPKADGKLLN